MISDWYPPPSKPRPTGKGRNKKGKQWWNDTYRKRRK